MQCGGHMDAASTPQKCMALCNPDDRKNCRFQGKTISMRNKIDHGRDCCMARRFAHHSALGSN